MKKNYNLFLALVVLCVSVTKAQLTLTKALFEPIAGDTYTNVAHDSNGVVPQITGANKVWNFTSLTKKTTTNAEVAYSYSNAAAVSSSTAYPGCNLVEVAGSGTGYTYYRTSASQLELMGQSGNATNFTFTNTAIVANWPIAFGYNNVDAFSGTLMAGTITANATGNMTVAASGTGTLQLPDGITLTNVLQLKVDQKITAPITIPGVPIPVTATINITNYQYYHSSDKFPIATAAYQKFSIPLSTPTVSSSYNINAKNVLIGLNESKLGDNSFSLYPNPVKNNLIIQINKDIENNSSIDIFNATGALVKSVRMEGNGSKLEIDTNTLPSGMYYLKLNTPNGTLTKKFIKE
jgi:hypothetical protein